ncbi:hypothetical protein NSERKGN1266_06760 [Nocardia seriolae]|nr:hypothetical protein NSERKGN1266_06760 [Nocardia seriolae]
MTEDASQLSVAELLARNGQQNGTPASGGGRRRRSGRGISVAELTGDIPVVPRAGSSSHAAPDDEAAAPAPEHTPIESDYSNFSNFSNNSDYSNFSEYADLYAAASSGRPETPSYSMPDSEPAYSPVSGPISYYDPLAPALQPPSLPEPSGQDWSAGLNWPPTENPLQPDGRATGGGRRRKPDPLDSEVSLDRLQGTETPAPPREGGRRRRYDPDDENTDEVRPFRGEAAPRPPLEEPARTQFNPAARAPFEDRTRFDLAAPAWPPAPGPEPLPRNPRPDRPGYDADLPGFDANRPGFDGNRSGFEPTQAAPAAPPMSRSARRHAEAQRQSAPPAERRGGVDHGAANGLPAWSARRRPGPEPAPGAPVAGPGAPVAGPGAPERVDQAAVPTAAWSSSLADDDQQLLSGQSVAGDLLRDAHDRDVERADRNSRNNGNRRGGGFRGRTAVAPEPDPADHLTDFYEPLDDDYDDYDDEPETSMAGRLSAFTQKAGALGRKAAGGSRAKRTAGAESAAARSRAKGRSDEDEHRRQWLMIAGQSVGAAVAGMLLFKGFERMWEMLPWVALTLAMIVILGLVALVRVLRRTDDIFSTVIAVVVGVFVTLGPLAFLLSTN